MCYVSDPIEILERQEEAQINLIDDNDTYPCIICGRRFYYMSMHPISAHPAAPLECGRKDCKGPKPKPQKGETEEQRKKRHIPKPPPKG